jgi:hypothetical protein
MQFVKILLYFNFLIILILIHILVTFIEKYVFDERLKIKFNSWIFINHNSMQPVSFFFFFLISIKK